VLGGGEQDRVGSPDARLQLDHPRGRLLVEVLVVYRDALQLEDVERGAGGQERLRRDEGRAVERRLPEAAGDAEDLEVGHQKLVKTPLPVVWVSKSL